MDLFTEDFDAFFSRMSGSSSGTLGTSSKGDRPLVVLGAKRKLPVFSFGTPATHKRKLGSLFTVPGDLMEGELDPVANKRIPHLTNFFFHSSECISTNMAIKADRLNLNEGYSRALKACHDVSAFHSYRFFFLVCHFFFSFFFCVGGLLP